ncbi:ADP-ribose pyrophosphatase YjhB (NUDIX family) [Crenobacter luteus]|uniref:NUDIX hydrolase n=1 Tax=Crenobacter luteus TaxID=1452487 RepID=UPI0010447FE1|nr:NUDIX hydrolase [Crenobacter luteus]TCP08484.1 ADP-ribose pyrophosphatase YjhB (NUDIX family) [Crenobacter luteus]
MDRQWKANVTVAAVIERDGRFLVVEEDTVDGRRFNQPAGHLERGESLVDAVTREVLEETGHHFVPEGLVGVYMADKGDGSDVTYLRFAFFGRVTGVEPARALDDGIVAARWLSGDELAALRDAHRSPLVGRCVADYLAGRRFGLELLYRHEDQA